ncbi:M56 family metallopeptidase [Mucilaginibacter angelicae]|uniref:M56 family metallopeptidase n=1 Tax=Mucilaginibacter angelicae TaxID=869718 RepID=A0ABV6L386_9SPHI
MDITIVKANPDYLVKALCSTLIHSLWQGVLLAALAGIIVVCTRQSSAVRRYNLLMAGLAIFAFTVAFTFVHELRQEKATLPVITGGQVVIAANTAVTTQPVTKTNDYQVVSRFLNDHSGSIVFVWFLVVMARVLQLLTGLHSLYYLRRRQVLAVSEAWENRVKQLALQLGIKRLVGIAESGMAKVPMVIGHLKPLILIPAGLITAMPPSAIEAILVHELAHIRRRDYIMNLLVSMMEIVFFFNPAVLWIASLIRAERENCCDDIAVTHTGSKVNYIRALVACQEYQLTAPAYAMALTGRKDHLMGRVKRMLSDNNQSLNVMERSLLAICLAMAILFTAAFSNSDKIGKLVNKVAHVGKSLPELRKQSNPQSVKVEPANKTTKTVLSLPKDTTFKAKPDTAKFRIYHPDEVGDHTSMALLNGNVQTRLVKVDGVLYQVNFLNEQINSLQVNGKTVPANEYSTYLPVIDQAMQRPVPVATVAQTARVARQPDPITPIKQPGAGLTPMKTSLGSLKTNPGGIQLSLGTYSDGAKAYNASAAKYNPADSYPETYKDYFDDTNRKKLTAELIAEGIIHNSDELVSFKLSDTEFIVNGKKMPDDIYQKIRKTYVKAPEKGKQGSWSWTYNFDVQTDSTPAVQHPQ